MTAPPRRPRDHALLDQMDAHPRRQFSGTLWIVARDGLDPLLSSRSQSRWCNGMFNVLHTSLGRDGAIEETHELLTLQSVFPSRILSRVYKLTALIESVVYLADLTELEQLGVDIARYDGYDYSGTQAIADAAFFLGFDGIVVPNARWACMNAILFSDRIDLAATAMVEPEQALIDWSNWQAPQKKRL